MGSVYKSFVKPGQMRRAALPRSKTKIKCLLKDSGTWPSSLEIKLGASNLLSKKLQQLCYSVSLIVTTAGPISDVHTCFNLMQACVTNYAIFDLILRVCIFILSAPFYGLFLRTENEIKRIEKQNKKMVGKAEMNQV